MSAQGQGEKKRPAALNPAPQKSDSPSSSERSLKAGPRTPRFVEDASVCSPRGIPEDVGLGYIKNNARASATGPKSPLKSALKVPGTPGKLHPLSPTFREDLLERREKNTEKRQAKDVKSKTRVRMAKFALRSINFGCSLIVLSMLGSSFVIFNSTRSLKAKNDFAATSFNSWPPHTNTWPQIVSLVLSCISLVICIGVFIAYCRGGHRRADKVNSYYNLFAIGWFMLIMILWLIAAAVLQHSKQNNEVNDIWSWACKQNTRATDFGQEVNYELVCRLQNWSLVCIVIEIVVEGMSIALYGVIIYRYYTKRKLRKSMAMRDRARSDLYLAQLRSQSAPNTPGFGPKSPSFSQYALSPRHPPPSAFRSMSDIKEGSPFTPGGRLVEPLSQFNRPQDNFKLQAPPAKAPSATPKTGPTVTITSPRTPTPPSENVAPHGPAAATEPVYESVPIPSAYADQVIKSPPPNQVSFGQAN